MLSKHLQLSNLFPFLFISPFPHKLKAFCRLFAGPLFLALIFSHRATATLLPPSDCITRPAPWDASRETQNLLDSVRQFHFAVPFFLLQSHPAVLHSWWETSLCPSEGEGGGFNLRASRSSCLSLMITMSQQLLHPPPPPCFAYLHSSLLFPPDCSLFLNLSGEKFTVLSSKFDLVQPQLMYIFASIFLSMEKELEKLPLLLGLFI